jgi:hypothetical protein
VADTRVLPQTQAFHPVADLFPLIEGEEFDDLVADVRARGVREPVWLYQDKVLDGRNRYLAAQAAGVECPTRAYDGDDPVGFVISLNLKRRHLDASQRAMIAAKLATLQQGARTDLSPIGERSQATAAKALNVGKRSVERAKIVRDQGGPELIKAVEAGEVSVSAAVDSISTAVESVRHSVRCPQGTCLDVQEWLRAAPIEDCQHILDAVGEKRVRRMIPPTWGMALAPAGENRRQIERLNARIIRLDEKLRDRGRTIERLQRQLHGRGLFTSESPAKSPAAAEGSHSNGAAPNTIEAVRTQSIKTTD